MDLLDAIQMAQEIELKAEALYADAAQKTHHPLGRGLFAELAKFERHHYDKLVELEKSLRGEGAFAGYEGRELKIEVSGEVGSIEEADKMSAMSIITMAIDVEREAEKRYTALAEQSTDPAVESMFKQLAKEENSHYRILSDAYWSLNNRGVWAWKG
jgi:rubrerythrin